MSGEIVDLAEARAVLRPVVGVAAEAERRRIVQDPDAHKLTTLMADHAGLNYVWWGLYRSPTIKGRAVAYCHSTGRNVAGYFLGWRETWTADGIVKRDQWTARRVKKALSKLQERRQARLAAAGYVRTTFKALKALGAREAEDERRSLRHSHAAVARRLEGFLKGERLQVTDKATSLEHVDRYGRRFRIVISRVPG
jgi:hypothetical protein